MKRPHKRRRRGFYPPNPDIREKYSAFRTAKATLTGRYEPLMPEQRMRLKTWSAA